MTDRPESSPPDHRREAAIRIRKSARTRILRTSLVVLAVVGYVSKAWGAIGLAAATGLMAGVGVGLWIATDLAYERTVGAYARGYSLALEHYLEGTLGTHRERGR